MKCICGYNNGNELDDDGNWIELNGEEFKKIKGHFVCEKDSYPYSKEIGLFACPKCQTIRISEH